MTKLKCFKAFQVVRDEGLRTIQLGWKGRLFGRRRAERICRFLQRRGHDVRVRYFGELRMTEQPPRFK